MARYRIEKRVANTDQWRIVAHAGTLEEATDKALEVEGGQSTGVRVCLTDSPHDVPVMIVGR
jgi:hypothetical protein